jgi:hypothetical protein
MNKFKTFLFWLPRVLTILFIIFLSLFSLDAFSEGYGYWEALGGFFMHNIPVFILLIVLLISWKWPEIGGLIFLGLGIFYLFLISGKAPLWGFLIVGVPVILIGLLFLFQKYFKEV